MPVITIPCPACGAGLKLPDASLIGKKGRCPKCQHRFVLTMPDPEEVPLQLADPPRPVIPRPVGPLVGTSARWVPDDDVPVLPSVASPAPLPSTPLPSTAMPSTAMPPVATAPEPAVAVQQVLVDPLAFAATSGDADSSVLNKVRGTARRRKSGRTWTILSIGIVAVTGLVAGGIFVAQRSAREAALAQTGPAANPAYEAEKQKRAASNETAEALSPTSGKNIPLDYLPFTPHVLCHLHPEALWKKDRATGEFQALLSNLGLWLHEQILTRTRFEPQDISELTFAINFGARMTEPDVAAVVRLREDQTPTDLMKRFKGRLRPDPNVEIYEADDFSFLLIDRRTFVVAPKLMGDALAESKDFPALASPDMEPLIQASDRDRHVSVMFDVRILDSHREDAFLPEMQPLFNQFMLWLGDGVETASWSMHLEPQLYMETLLHPTTASSVVKEQRKFQVALNHLPGTMLETVRRMQPGTAGSRQMIGRFPVMLAALDVGTTTHVSPMLTRAVTLLPRHAAANLAAGSLLTWNQSLVTDWNADHRTTQADQAIPGRIVDRLQMQVLVDFRRMPLQEAFGYIGETIKTEVSIDGDALKAAGFTQNMEQTYNLGSVTAQVALDTILKKYAGEKDPMVLIVDEAGKRLLLSTASKAAADGMTVFKTGP